MLGVALSKSKHCLVTVLLCSFLLTTTLPVIHNVRAQKEDYWNNIAPLTNTTSSPKPPVNPKVAVANRKIYAITDSTTQEYDPTTNTWTSKTSMPTPRKDFAITAYKNKIYTIGGKTSNGLAGTNEVYNPRTDSWETKKDMPTPRRYLEANTVKDKIYLIAGYNNTGEFIPDFNEVYSPETDTWTTKAPMPIPKYAYASAVLDNKIYFFAGGTTESNINQIYDTETDSWSEGMRLPSFCRSIAAAATTGTWVPKRIYVIGGQKGFAEALNLNRIYDPVTDEWSTGASMKTSRYGLSVAVVDDFLYAIGGGDGLVIIRSNEVYDPQADLWRTIKEIPIPTPIPTPNTTPTPTPTIEATPTPTPSPEPEPFPTTLAVASIATISVVDGS